MLIFFFIQYFYIILNKNMKQGFYKLYKEGNLFATLSRRRPLEAELSACKHKASLYFCFKDKEIFIRNYE
jgi:hypothetical protein